MFACRAAKTAARSRGLAVGSGRPERAAVVSSRIILVKILARFLSCAPLRYMMFLNCEWPAISVPGSDKEWNVVVAAPDPAISRSCSFTAAYQSNMAAMRRILNPILDPARAPERQSVHRQ